MDAQPELIRFGAVGLAQPGGSTSPDAVAACLLRLAELVEQASDLAVVVLPLAGCLIAAGAVPANWDRVLAAWSGLRATTVGALDGRLSYATTTLSAVLDFRIAARGTVLTAYCCGVADSCLHPRLVTICDQIHSFELSPTNPIQAPDAMMAGLADDLAPPGQVIPAALRWAQRVAESPETARRMAKLAIRGIGLRQSNEPHFCPLRARTA